MTSFEHVNIMPAYQYWRVVDTQNGRQYPVVMLAHYVPASDSEIGPEPIIQPVIMDDRGMPREAYFVLEEHWRLERGKAEEQTDAQRRSAALAHLEP